MLAKSQARFMYEAHCGVPLLPLSYLREIVTDVRYYISCNDFHYSYRRSQIT